MKEFIDKLISRLEEEKAKRFYDYDAVIGEKNVWSKAISIVNELAEEYKVSEIPTGWIPCSERLPSKAGDYLVCSKGTVWTANYYWNTWWSVEKKVRFTDIEAWQPLPAPYQQKESNSEIPNNSTWKQNVMERFERVE